MVCGVDAGRWRSAIQTSLTSLAKTTLFNANSKIAAPRRLNCDIRATGNLYRIGRHPHLTPREVGAGVRALEANHNRQPGRFLFRRPNQSDRYIAACGNMQILATLAHTANRRLIYNVLRYGDSIAAFVSG
jgi:hypothetical protein